MEAPIEKTTQTTRIMMLETRMQLAEKELNSFKEILIGKGNKPGMRMDVHSIKAGQKRVENLIWFLGTTTIGAIITALVIHFIK